MNATSTVCALFFVTGTLSSLSDDKATEKALDVLSRNPGISKMMKENASFNLYEDGETDDGEVQIRMGSDAPTHVAFFGPNYKVDKFGNCWEKEIDESIWSTMQKTIFPLGALENGDRATITIPRGFQIIETKQTGALTDQMKDRIWISLRIRSSDGAVEFEFLGVNARHLEGNRELQPQVRGNNKLLPDKREELWIRPSENESETYRTVDFHSHFSQDSKTTYFNTLFSEGNLAGSSTILWELHATSEKAREKYSRTYLDFKNSFKKGES